ncbi:hypothetical protein BU17DRAFT_66110 [Hysterangium stoloniferum]|nr:hypothetical protein BU17DRAFT_66110 [Hysterangium stoloniferum]
MPKSPSKAIEVIADSEEEEQPKSKKKTTKVAEPSSDEAGDANEEGDEDEDEEEYEIESILDAKNGAFPGGKMGYLVKWKGYDDEHNSWVVQEDAANAQDLINEFWEQQKRDKKSKTKGTTSRGRARKSETEEVSREPDEVPSSNKRKKSTPGGKSKSGAEEEQEDEPEPEKPQAKKAKTSAVKKAKEQTTPPEERNAMDVDAEPVVAEPAQYMPIDDKTREKKSWETLVRSIDTIERIDGTLKVFFTLKNGDRVVETSKECAKHFPQKLISFYESNLRWRELETM